MSVATAMPVLEDQICFALYRASMAVNRFYMPMLAELNITYPQYLVLSTLWERDHRTIGDIAQRLALEPSTVTPLAKRLEAAGFVTRFRNALDERQVFADLTEAGKAMQEKSKCLGETLVKAAGISKKQFLALNQEIRAFHEAITVHKPQSGQIAPKKRH